MKLNKIIFALVFALCLIAISVPHHGSSGGPLAAPTFKEAGLSIKTAHSTLHFAVELAETQAQESYGLMYRKTMPRDHGMLFLLDSDQNINMWMKNTILSLDMLFIDGHGKIVHIARDAVPNSEKLINPGQPVRAVIELLAGTAAMDDIQVGDTVVYPYFKP